MSWQGYVDTNLVGTGTVTQAAIIGLKGGVWATSPNFTLTAEEQKALIAGFDDPAPLQAGGIRASGVKYFTLGADAKTIRGKQGANGLIACKTNQAVLVAQFESPITPGQAAKTVEGLADYLIGSGY